MNFLRLFALAIAFVIPLQADPLMPEKLYQRLVSLQVPLTQQFLIINVGTQKLTLYEQGQPIKEYPISTAKNGTGSHSGSYQTPLGLHKISEKIGMNSPQYSIFESRTPTGQLWQPGGREASDLILSRILRLKGLEPGLNKGRNTQGVVVDSHDRFIYIHGTNHEKSLGLPASQGCIRMSNRDIIDLFPRVKKDALVWITER